MFTLTYRTSLEQITSDIRHLQRSTDRHNAEIASYHLQRYYARRFVHLHECVHECAHMIQARKFRLERFKMSQTQRMACVLL